MAKSLKPIWLADLTNEACLYVNQRNYTTCGVIIDRDFPYEIIDHQRVKYIPFGTFGETEEKDTSNRVMDFLRKTENTNEYEEKAAQEDDKTDEARFREAAELPEDRIVYVADSENHCIRKITLK